MFLCIIPKFAITYTAIILPETTCRYAQEAHSFEKKKKNLFSCFRLFKNNVFFKNGDENVHIRTLFKENAVSFNIFFNKKVGAFVSRYFNLKGALIEDVKCHGSIGVSPSSSCFKKMFVIVNFHSVKHRLCYIVAFQNEIFIITFYGQTIHHKSRYITGIQN